MKRKYHIGVDVLHINAGDKTLCGIVPKSGRAYDLDVLKRIGRVKPLCRHCQRREIKTMYDKRRKG